MLVKTFKSIGAEGGLVNSNGTLYFDADNREAPPRGATTLGAPPPFHPTEDAIDASVREDLDRWFGGLALPLLGVLLLSLAALL